MLCGTGARAGGRRLEVSSWEVAQAAAGSRNYTVLTLEMLGGKPGLCCTAIGSDMLLSFEGWHRWQDILRLARVVVTSRDIGDAPGAARKGKAAGPVGRTKLLVPPCRRPWPAGQLRARREGEAELPEECAASSGGRDYTGTQKEEMDLKQAKRALRSRLSDKRYEHTINVKKMAVKLASTTGTDPEQAALAALLQPPKERPR